MIELPEPPRIEALMELKLLVSATIEIDSQPSLAKLAISSQAFPHLFPNLLKAIVRPLNLLYLMYLFRCQEEEQYISFPIFAFFTPFIVDVQIYLSISFLN